MLRNHFAYQTNSQRIFSQFSTSRNQLGVVNTEFIWDRKRNNLVILTETSQMIGPEIKATIQGNRLILEASIISSYEKPFRTHLLGKEIEDEFENELTEIGFSEIIMEPGYEYSLKSCHAINSRMIKVILEFSRKGRERNN